MNIRLGYWLLAGWAVAWFAGMALHGGMAWNFFDEGSRALVHFDDPRGGLHLYAAAPILQIGPVAFLVAAALRSVVAAQVFGAAAGAYVMWQAHRLGHRWSWWAAVCFVPVWMYLAVASAHLDDVLALAAAVAALAAARYGRPVAAGLLLGLAIDAKPWALGFAALLLLLPGPRAMLRGALSTAAAVVAGWLPFFLADGGTVRALRFTIPNTSLSALRALGVTDARTPPWDRPAQALLGIGLGIVAVRRGNWPAVLLLGTAARLALEPGTNKYYAAGAVVGALVWDLAGSTARFPWWTAGAMVALHASRWLPVPDDVHGRIILTYCLACVAVLFQQPRPTPVSRPAIPAQAGPSTAVQTYAGSGASRNP